MCYSTARGFGSNKHTACLGCYKGVLFCARSIDVFFLDWEKPRRVLAKGGAREESGPVSAWRSLLVANEWNELQTARMTNPALTMVVLVRHSLAWGWACLCVGCSCLSHGGGGWGGKTRDLT